MLLRSPDVTFFHPPAIYDFRERADFLGPISDVIPSSPIFEMYPVGLTSIADHLETHGFDVRIVNLAHQMLDDPGYDAEMEVRRCPAEVVGIDLHWLPHAHGAIEVARLVKKYHPDVPVVLGGLSATYFHDELVTYPSVDYVVRGDATREPMLQLVETLTGDGDLSTVPNLTYHDGDEPVVNPLSYVPDTLDFSSIPAYSYVIRSVMKYGSLKKVLPYRGWLDDPVTMLLTSHGCTYNCTFCGGCASAYRDHFGRDEPAFRSPEKLVEDVRSIRSFSTGPIFVVNDIRMGGPDYADDLLTLLSGTDVDNEFVFELFRPAEPSFFRRLDEAVDSYSLELSLESASRDIRERVGKFGVPNAEIERTLRAAFDNGCNTVDAFFMIGLPGQTYDDVLDTVDYIDELMDRFPEDRLKPFIAPLAPFLDPGSPGFENPEAYGYTRFCESFEDHRQALLEPSWKRMLSYETDWMSRDDIVAATYEAASRFNEIKFEHGRIDRDTYETVARRIEESRAVIAEIDELYERDLTDEQRRERVAEIHERVENRGEYSICGDQELSWVNNGLQNAVRLGALGARLAVDGVRNRLLGHP